MAGIRTLDVKGMSVTIPHKLSVMYHLDKIDEQAAKIGAVNTIKNDNGYLTGYNTDCLGAVNALLEKTSIKGKKVVRRIRALQADNGVLWSSPVFIDG